MDSPPSVSDSPKETLSFICGCTKRFQSYKALYMHVRGKHGGNYPPGTYAPDRPMPTLKSSRRNSLTHQEFAENLSAFVEKMNDCSEINETALGADNLQSYFKLGLIGWEKEENEMIEALKYIMEIHQKEGGTEVNNDFSIWHIFAGLIISSYPSTKRNMIKEFFVFIVLFLSSFLKEHANAFDEKLRPVSNNSYNIVAEYSNDFVCTVLPSILSNWKSEFQLSIVGCGENQAKDVLIMMMIMLDWLFLNSLINNRYSLDIDFKPSE